MPPPNRFAQAETFSPDELYNVLCGATSQNPSQVQASAARLKEIMQIPGAYDTLHEIAAQRTVPLAVRQQSIIQFKNAALGHWRSRKYLSDEQRARIRARCMSLLDEADDVIAECNEFIVAKIARTDLPNNWPALISELVGLIGINVEARYAGGTSGPGVSAIVLRRSLDVLNAILKELASVKLPGGMKTMGALAEQLHLVLQSHYSRITASFSSSISPSTISLPHTAEDLLFAHLAFKCLVKIAVWSWHKIVTQREEAMRPWSEQLFQASATQLQSLSELRINLTIALRSTPTDAVGQRSVDILTRHVRLFGKLFRRVQQLQVARFVELPFCSDLVLYYWSKVVQASSAPQDYIVDTPDTVFPVRFLVQAMMLFKDSLGQWAPIKKGGVENANALSRDFVENAVRLLVTRFIPLNPSDLEEWMADPEGWVNVEEQDNEQWVFEIRPCAERVLMTLANHYHQYVAPLLETTFKQLVGQRPADLPSVLQKEALYCAIGRCAHRMKDVIPFNQWLEQTLIAEAQETNASYPILKRRIAWLIGKWISEDCYPSNDPKIWQVLLYLLQDRGPGTDEVVRLTAAIALRECIDSLHFDADVFGPFLPGTVNELVRLTAEAETLESKRRIAQSLNTLIERAETRIVPLIGIVAEPLPQLWTTAGEDWLFKSSLLVTVTKLIESSREHSSSLHSLVVSLVRDSLSPGSQLHLDEDALILWQGALRDAVTVGGVNGGAGLIDLFPLAVSLLSENLDLLGKVIGIVESYFLLDAPRVLQGYAADLFRAYGRAIGQAVAVNVVNMATSLTLLFQVAPSSLWGEALHVSGLFSIIVDMLAEDKAQTSILTEYIYLLSRIAVADRNLFLLLMSAMASSQNKPESSLYEGVLNQWWTRFDNMSEPRLRKLAAMGIANLVATGRPEVLDRLSTEICNLWIDVFGEIKEAQAQSGDDLSPSLTLYWERPLDSFFQDSEGTLEYDRRKALFDNDHVRTTQLTAYIAARLREAEAACGGPANFQAMYLAKADPLLLKQIQAELAGKSS